MKTAHVRYRGPNQNGWQEGACYEVYFDASGSLSKTVRIGTYASHNDLMEHPAPLPMRLTGLKRFLEWFDFTDKHFK
jgi:hypothetical protein